MNKMNNCNVLPRLIMMFALLVIDVSNNSLKTIATNFVITIV